MQIFMFVRKKFSVDHVYAKPVAADKYVRKTRENGTAIHQKSG